MTATINHADYSNLASFARVCQDAFAGVAVLPNREVMAACLRCGRCRGTGKPCTVSVVCDDDNRTAYLVAGFIRDEVIVIDSRTGACEVVTVDDDAAETLAGMGIALPVA